MIMKNFSSLITLIFLLQTPFLAIADRKLIETTCKSTPLYNLCFSTLISSPKSSNADIAGLGLIMVAATKARATQALDKINKLAESQPELRRQLRECAESYNAVVSADVPEAVEALSKGDPKFAENGMADVAVEAQGCESSFGRSRSPVTQLNKAVYDLSVVARSIIRMLL